MKKHNSVKVIIITLVVAILLTWILPTASFQNEMVVGDYSRIGIFNLTEYSLTTFAYFGHIILFILTVGAFYGVLNKIPAYSELIKIIAKKFEKNSLVFISCVMIICSLLTSICGLQLGLFLFFPLIASIIFAMGYDKIMVALSYCGSIIVGLIGTTYASSNVSYLNQILDTKITDNIGIKFSILIISLAILIFNVIKYAEKNPIKKVKEEVKEEKEEKVEEIAKESEEEKVSSAKTVEKNTNSKKKSNSSSKKKNSKKSKSNNKAAVTDVDVIKGKNLSISAISILSIFGLLFVLSILAFIPWNVFFEVNPMETALNSIFEFKIFKFELFANLLGNVGPFGGWIISDLILPVVVFTAVLSFICHLSIDDVFDGISEGVKKYILPAFISFLVYLMLVIVTYHQFQGFIYKFMIDISGGFNSFTASIIALISGVINGDSAYAFQSSAPYIKSLVEADKVASVGIIYQVMYGVSMIFAPTSLVLMTVLSSLEISFKDWIKSNWKLIVELLIVALFISIIAVATM